LEFDPQHHREPLFRIAHTDPVPAAIATAGPPNSVEVKYAEGEPHDSGSRDDPQHIIVPSFRRAQVLMAPEDIATGYVLSLKLILSVGMCMPYVEVEDKDSL
jgi:hypothetical protein